MRYFFHCFWSLLGRYPPYLAIMFGSVMMDGALHISRTVVDMLEIRVSNEVDGIFHCSTLK